MFDHIGIAVRDLERSREFYAAALAPLGVEEVMRFERYIGFGRDRPQFWIMEGTSLESEPRMHLAFTAGNRLEVETFHRAALDAGGIDNGAPGVRSHYHPDYYGAFVIDPDGHNVEAVCHKPPA